MPQQDALRRPLDRAIDSALDLQQAAVQPRSGQRRHVILGEVDLGFHLRQQVQALAPQLAHLPGKRASKLFFGGLQRQIGGRAHGVRHRFGLRKVNAAAQESAQRELARPGLPRSGVYYRPQGRSDRSQPAVTAHLHNVLASVGMRSAHVGDHRLVYMRTVFRIHEPAQRGYAISGQPP